MGLFSALFVRLFLSCPCNPDSKKPVVLVDGQWKTIESEKEGEIVYGTPSEAFNTDSKPTLDKLSCSDIGMALIQNMQDISTRVVIDENDEEAKKSAPITANSVVFATITDDYGNPVLNEDGLPEEIQITPLNANIQENATKDKVDFEEKLIGTMTVELAHKSTPEQVQLENKKYKKIYKDPEVFAEVYNDMMNQAISNMIAYRKQQSGDGDDVNLEGVFKIYERFKAATTMKGDSLGANVKLNDANQKLYDKLQASKKKDGSNDSK